MNEFTAHVARVLQLPRPAMALQGAGCAQRVAPIAVRLGEPVTADLYIRGLDLLWSSTGQADPDAATDLVRQLEEVPEVDAIEAQSPELYVFEAVETLTGALRILVDADHEDAARQFTGCASELAQVCDTVADQHKKGLLGRPGPLLDPFSDAERSVREQTLTLLRDGGPTAETVAQIQALSGARAAAIDELIPRFAEQHGLTDRGA